MYVVAVSIVKFRKQGKNVERALSLLGGSERQIHKGDSVFIKVNSKAGSVNRFRPGAVTSLKVISEVVDFVLSLDAEPVIGEGTPSSRITQTAIENTGLEEYAKHRGVKLINLDEDKKVCKNLPGCRVLKELEIPQTVLNSDVIINVPVMKTHTMTGVSLGLKNMIGIACGKQLRLLHSIGIDEAIVDLNTAIKPNLTIIDGTIAMEGQGPVLGDPITMNLMIAGFDPVAVDSVATRIMGFDPYEIKHLLLAARRNLGVLDSIQILGETIESCVKCFKKPQSKGITNTILMSKIYNKIAYNGLMHYFLYEEGYFLLKSLLDYISRFGV